MKSYKKSLLYTVIGFVMFPTVVLGGTFGSSLIQGKSVPEAIQILAQQIDYLIPRVEVLETKQNSLAEQQEALEGKQTEQEQIIQELREIVLQQEEPNIEQISNGIITIYNNYSSSPQTLVGNTRFLYTDTNPVFRVFRTTESVIVPGGGEGCIGSINAIVKADKSGSEYLLTCSETQPCDFTIPGFKGTGKYTAFYAKSFSNFTFEEITNFQRTVNNCN